MIVIVAIAITGLFLPKSSTVVQQPNNAPLGAVVGPDYYDDFRFHSSVTYQRKVITPTFGYGATTTLSVADSGATILQATSTGVNALELPSVANAGVHYKFVVADAFATNNFVIATKEGESNVIEGALIVAGAVVDCAAESEINFVADGENVGDFVELMSTGSEWVILQSGGLTTAKITCTP